MMCPNAILLGHRVTCMYVHTSLDTPGATTPPSVLRMPSNNHSYQNNGHTCIVQNPIARESSYKTLVGFFSSFIHKGV